jgi:hypothetical protein
MFEKEVLRGEVGAWDFVDHLRNRESHFVEPGMLI